jgi:hypothetical protein
MICWKIWFWQSLKVGHQLSHGHTAETHEMGTDDPARMRVFNVRWIIPAIKYVPISWQLESRECVSEVAIVL